METEGCDDDFVYQYEAIEQNEIRVLVLLAGERDDDLWGYFETSDLDERPVYKALSYAWGAPVFSHTLYLVGGAIAITPVVHAALRRLRDQDVPVRLWIDAICINQRNNVAEKNHQVSRMAQIYQEAHEVLIWLADQNHNDDHNHQMIERLNGWYTLKYDWRTSRLGRLESIALEDSWSRDGPASSGFNDSLSLLHTLWASPWFTRLWVVQEAAAGARLTFLYGKYSAGFTSIRRALAMSVYLATHTPKKNASGFPDLQCVLRAHATLTHLSRLRDPIPSPELRDNGWRRFVTITDQASIRSRLASAVLNQAGGRFLHNLVWCSDLSVTDPHDLIYAVRSLSGIENVESLSPDYSLPLVELWTRVSRHILSTQADPFIVLSLAGISCRDNILDLPSWAIDVARIDECSRKRHRDCCRAAIEHSAAPCEDEGKAFTSEEKTHFAFHWTGPLLLSSPGVQLFRILALFSRDETPEYALLDQKREFDTLSYRLLDRELKVCGPNGSPGVSEQTLHPNMEEAKTWYIGWLPDSTQVGDAVYILQGCPLPFVLRPLQNGRYILVGEVYRNDSESCPLAKQLRFPWPSDGKDVVDVILQ